MNNNYLYMNNSLLNKYKPKVMEDFNINKYTNKLINLYINNNKLNFLIHGSCCSGKSSLINVILQKYYGEDMNVLNSNIIHMNLLKEPGINYYRNELKNFCQIHNLNKLEKKKTIIFDDIDLLNEQCQQIFSTLISNYENINFIFACNDLNKIHSNIINKLELINILNTDDKFLLIIINKIILNENYVLKEDQKKYIIKLSNLSIPRMINNINKLILIHDKIENINDIDAITSNILISDFENYLILCKNNNYHDSINYIMQLYIKGFSMIDILDDFFLYIKNHSNLNEKYKYAIIKLICNYINIFNNIHEDNIELIFLTNNIIKIFNQ